MRGMTLPPPPQVPAAQGRPQGSSSSHGTCRSSQRRRFRASPKGGEEWGGGRCYTKTQGEQHCRWQQWYQAKRIQKSTGKIVFALSILRRSGWYFCRPTMHCCVHRGNQLHCHTIVFVFSIFRSGWFIFRPTVAVLCTQRELASLSHN